MKHWLLSAALICFGSSAAAAPGSILQDFKLNAPGSEVCIEVSSSDVKSVTSASISDPYVADMSSYTYRLVYSARMLTQGSITWFVTANNDSSAHYFHSVNTVYTVNIICDGTSAASNGVAVVWFGGNAFGASSEFAGDVMVRSVQNGNGKTVFFVNNSEFYDSQLTFAARVSSGGRWAGSAAMTSLTLSGSTNSCAAAVTADKTFNAHLELWRCGRLQVNN